jgi:hypothetical protein
LPALTRSHRPRPGLGWFALLLTLSAAACADMPTEARTPIAGPLAQAAPGGFRQEYQFPLPANSGWPHFLASTQTPIVIPRDGRYLVRVRGSVTMTLNPAYPGPCNVDGTPAVPGPGTFGPQGWTNQWRQRVMQARVNTEPIGFYGYNLGLPEVDAQTVEGEVYFAAGQTLHVDWTGHGGTMWCGVEVPYYLFTGGLTLSVTEVRENPAALVLECNGVRGAVSVQREAALNCEAKTEPAGGEVTDARWSFRDAGGAGPPVAGPAGQNAWSGPMVVGGTITLAAKVNGAEQTATASVAVTPRTWRDSLPELRTVYCPAGGVSRCPLHNPPVYVKDLGQTTLAPGTFRLSGQAVQQGPNTGWHYLPGAQGPIRFTRFTMYLNSVLQDPRNRLFRGGCSAPRVTSWIVDHENVHVAKFRRAIAQQRLNPELEDVMAFTDADFQRQLRRADARITRLLSDIGDQDHSDSGYPADPCNLPLRDNP